MKLRYKNYGHLIDAAQWTGCEIEFTPNCSDHLILRHRPTLTLWVEVPLIEYDAPGEVRLLQGTLSDELAEALGITKSSWVDRLKWGIACTDFDWVPTPLWAIIVSPLLSWAIQDDTRLFVWPAGRSKKPWRASFWHGYGPWDKE